VVRAGALWKGGEVYHFDTNASAAPAWWVSGTNTAGTNSTAGTSRTQAKQDDPSAVLSVLPATYLPGVPFTVTNFATPSPNITVYAVEDQPPAGWAVANISAGGSYDVANGKVKWGLFFDHTARSLTYQVTPPANAQGPVGFAGLASFDGMTTVPVSGQRVSTFFAPPQLQPLGLTAARAPHFLVRGVPGQSLNVQYSADLLTWQPLATILIAPAGTYDYIDAAGIGRTRFYRARPAP
jgi:hypothetical protein